MWAVIHPNGTIRTAQLGYRIEAIRAFLNAAYSNEEALYHWNKTWAKRGYKAALVTIEWRK